jgi:hypothetical protein
MLDRTDDALAFLAQRIEAEHNAVATAQRWVTRSLPASC